jgi:hypothetical protein
VRAFAAVKLTKSPDGTIHVEGTPDEVRELLAPARDAVGKMLVQYPPFAPACAPLPGHVWVGTIKPTLNAAACAAAPTSFVWPPLSSAGML